MSPKKGKVASDGDYSLLGALGPYASWDRPIA